MGIEKAEIFSAEKHKGKMRKFREEPYSEHPKRVAEIVKKYEKCNKMGELISAALLHDTLEKTDTKEKELKDLFGNLITSLGKQLTSIKEKVEKIGKKEYLAKKMSNEMSDWGLIIKLADRLDNVDDLRDIEKRDEEGKKFVLKYSDETKYILDNLEANRKLSFTQKRLVNEIRKKLA